MASEYTANYELPIWAAGDAFLRTEFNDANQKVEGALTELDGRIGDSCPGNGYQLTLSLRQPCPVVCQHRVISLRQTAYE